MTEDDAYAVLSPLAVAFSYSEDQLILWRDMLTGLNSLEAAQVAAAKLIRDAEGSYVPGWGKFQAVYDRYVVQQRLAEDEEVRALEERSSTRIPSVVEGLKIAKEAYEAECARQEREPTPGFFESMMDPVARVARRAEIERKTHR